MGSKIFLWVGHWAGVKSATENMFDSYKFNDKYKMIPGHVDTLSKKVNAKICLSGFHGATNALGRHRNGIYWFPCLLGTDANRVRSNGVSTRESRFKSVSRSRVCLGQVRPNNYAADSVPGTSNWYLKGSSGKDLILWALSKEHLELSFRSIIGDDIDFEIKVDKRRGYYYKGPKFWQKLPTVVWDR